MKFIEWNSEKNAKLKEECGISFEEVELALLEGRVLAVMAHPNPDRFPHQRVIVFELERYAYVVPYVMKDKNTFFLKTIYPSRAMTKRFLENRDE